MNQTVNVHLSLQPNWEILFSFHNSSKNTTPKHS